MMPNQSPTTITIHGDVNIHIDQNACCHERFEKLIESLIGKIDALENQLKETSKDNAQAKVIPVTPKIKVKVKVKEPEPQEPQEPQEPIETKDNGDLLQALQDISDDRVYLKANGCRDKQKFEQLNERKAKVDRQLYAKPKYPDSIFDDLIL